MNDVTFPHPLEPYPRLIINVALTGVIPTKAMTPHVPTSPDEIVADACRCFDAGAAIIHVHARDAQGKPTYDPSVFARIIRGIRAERPQAIICATTSGRRHGKLEERSAVLELTGIEKPDLASLTMGSLNFPDGPSVNAPDMIECLAARMLQRGIKPELEILDLGMINAANVLIRRGLIEPPYYFNLLLGSIYTCPATLLNLATAVENLPRRCIWSVAGLGRFQLAMNVAGILMGGHLRTGLEDNLYLDNARLRLATNPQLVERIVRIAAEFDRPVATGPEARAMLELPCAPGRPGDVVIDRALPKDVPSMIELLKIANMHHIPSEEMPELDPRCYFVARVEDRVVGLAGWKILSPTEGKTTLMVVHPDWRKQGLGHRLQEARLLRMAACGVQAVTTNADLPETIAWYQKHFGYFVVGKLRKIHEFGAPHIPEWTTLRLDLQAWVASRGGPKGQTTASLRSEFYGGQGGGATASPPKTSKL